MVDSDNKEQINLEKLKIEEDSSAFAEIEKTEKKLDEDDDDKVVKAKDTGADVPENLLKDDYQLFEKDTTWESLGVREEIIKGLIEIGFIRPSRIQAASFKLVTKEPYSHLIAQAHNGSGKTGAFGISTLQRIDENQNEVQAVIFAHTKILVNQTVERLQGMAKYTKIKISALHNKINKSDVAHIFVTTPSVFDTQFFGQKKQFNLKTVKVLVLDEADYMFKNDQCSDICDKTFETIIKNKIQTQVLFFSATFTDSEFKAIKKFFKSANIIKVEKGGLTLKNVRQMYYKAKSTDDKINFLEEYLKRNFDQERVIIFMNTKNFAAKLSDTLRNRGYKVYLLMGGDMDPAERQMTVDKFNKGEIQILITTNILSRGFDERKVKLIINFDIPVLMERTKVDLENYLHRIGRTGRFGAKGIGLTIISSEGELKMLKELEEYYGSNIEEIKSMDELVEEFKKVMYQD
jgi:ATP-dependent RNA helicase DDX19/DBP5